MAGIRLTCSSNLLQLPSSHDEAERCFRESLDLAPMQGAGSYELRTVTDLAALLRLA
jgi:hypothetical protein